MSLTETQNEILERLNWRYATKKFDSSKKVSKEDLEVLLETIQLSASSYGVQPYRVAVIENEEKRKELQPKAWNQAQIVDASHLLVFCARTDVEDKDIDSLIEYTAEERGLNKADLSDYSNFMKDKIIKENDADTRKNWTARQAYIAIGNLLNAAAEMEIDACPMEGFNPEEFDEALGLKEKGLYSVALVTLGYRSTDDQAQHNAKVRRPKEELFFHIK